MHNIIIIIIFFLCSVSVSVSALDLRWANATRRFSVPSCVTYVTKTVGTDYSYVKYIHKDSPNKSYAYLACDFIRKLRHQKIATPTFLTYFERAVQFSIKTR